MAWGDGLISKVPAVQAQGLEFGFPAHICDPNTRGRRQMDLQGLKTGCFRCSERPCFRAEVELRACTFMYFLSYFDASNVTVRVSYLDLSVCLGNVERSLLIKIDFALKKWDRKGLRKISNISLLPPCMLTLPNVNTHTHFKIK